MLADFVNDEQNYVTNVAVMERNNVSGIYSFDKAFDNIPWLKRKEA